MPFLLSVRTKVNRRRVAVALLVLMAVVAGSRPSDADLKSDLEALKKEQQEIQQRKKDASRQVDLATAEAGELAAALEIVTAEVNEQATKVEAAQRALAAAESSRDSAVRAVVVQQANIEGLEGRLSNQAISGFVNQNNPRSPMLEEIDPNRAVRMQSLVQAVTEDGISVTDELRAAKEDLQIEQAEATNAAEEAERIQALMAADLAELERRQARQAELWAAAEDRLDRNLAEAAALAELDKDLAASILKKNEELIAQTRLQQQRNPAPSSGGSPSFPSASQIVNVRGIWVHTDIADNLDRMLGAAESQGHFFSGGGYRDSANQIRLRKAHCGTSNYAIYQKPSSQCRPPTARPGRSQHEQGKAIDFRYNNSIIGTRNNAGYRWLAANAGSYGFYNLPSEPWHWSVNGR